MALEFPLVLLIKYGFYPTSNHYNKKLFAKIQIFMQVVKSNDDSKLLNNHQAYIVINIFKIY